MTYSFSSWKLPPPACPALLVLRLKKDDDDDEVDDDVDDYDDDVDVDDDVDDVVVVVVWLTKAEHLRFKGPKKDRLSKYFSVSSSLIILSKKMCVCFSNNLQTYCSTRVLECAD